MYVSIYLWPLTASLSGIRVGIRIAVIVRITRVAMDVRITASISRVSISAGVGASFSRNFLTRRNSGGRIVIWRLTRCFAISRTSS